MSAMPLYFTFPLGITEHLEAVAISNTASKFVFLMTYKNLCVLAVQSDLSLDVTGHPCGQLVLDNVNWKVVAHEHPFQPSSPCRERSKDGGGGGDQRAALNAFPLLVVGNG